MFVYLHVVRLIQFQRAWTVFNRLGSVGRLFPTKVLNNLIIVFFKFCWSKCSSKLTKLSLSHANEILRPLPALTLIKSMGSYIVKCVDEHHPKYFAFLARSKFNFALTKRSRDGAGRRRSRSTIVTIRTWQMRLRLAPRNGFKSLLHKKESLDKHKTATLHKRTAMHKIRLILSRTLTHLNRLELLKLALTERVPTATSRLYRWV